MAWATISFVLPEFNNERNLECVPVVFFCAHIKSELSLSHPSDQNGVIIHLHLLQYLCFGFCHG